MVKYVGDTTGRFSQRPHYEQSELDQECERLITDFLMASYGHVILPVPTDALTKLIERDADDLDLYADLSEEGPGVEGVTTFFVDRKPRVRIAKELSEDERREHRLRTTLTHEYGHVFFHAPLWRAPVTQNMFPELVAGTSQSCHRDSIVAASPVDWMEWQAGYVCSSLLTPISRLMAIVEATFSELGLYGSALLGTPGGSKLIRRVMDQFDVSHDAARVRLIKLGYLSYVDQQSLFHAR
jgi:hypothetical protein